MNNGWFVIYALGCMCSVVVMAVNVIIAWLIGWVTHANTANRNLKKLQPPDNTSWAVRAVKFIAWVVFEIALSWISVAFGVWRFVRVILELFRDLFASVPEAVRTLRFPLRTNPDLSRESVWAYVCALGTLVGQPVTQPNEVLSAFDEVFEHYPNFDRRLALRQLQSLHVIRRYLPMRLLCSIAGQTRSKRTSALPSGKRLAAAQLVATPQEPLQCRVAGPYFSARRGPSG